MDCVIVVVTGNSFLLRMVRNIVAKLVQIGAGYAPPDDTKRILMLKDRTQLKIAPAPAHGLYLVDVNY